MIVATDINGLALVRLAVPSPGDLNCFRCSPEELVWWRVASKDFVGQRAIEASVELPLR
jgi:hypothetical protein